LKAALRFDRFRAATYAYVNAQNSLPTFQYGEKRIALFSGEERDGEKRMASGSALRFWSV
jgi:hypothetical protein